MEFNERTLLLEHCATSIHAYTRASINWQKLTSRANTLEYRDSLKYREQARTQVDLADYQLEQHERVHLCHPATAN